MLTAIESRTLARAAAILERHTLQGRDAMTSPQAVRDYLRTRIACLPHEVFACLFLDSQHRVIACEELFRGTLAQTFGLSARGSQSGPCSQCCGGHLRP